MTVLSDYYQVKTAMQYLLKAQVRELYVVYK